jgi:hypothetical protein
MKKIISLVLAIAVSTILVGCEKKAEPKKDKAGDATKSASASGDTTKTETGK